MSTALNLKLTDTLRRRRRALIGGVAVVAGSMATRRLVVATLVSLALFGAMPLPRAQAATIVVSGSCSLVNAITSANSDTAVGGCTAGSLADTITLQAGVTYTIATRAASALGGDDWGGTGLPAITSDITIVGDATSGAIIERSSAGGTPAFRLFHVRSGGSLTLRNLTLRNGLAQGASAGTSDQGGGGGGGAGLGGAIFNDGSLTLRGVLISGSSAVGGDGGDTDSGTATDGGGGGGGTSPLEQGDASASNNGGAGHGRDAIGSATSGAGGTSGSACGNGSLGGTGSGGGGGARRTAGGDACSGGPGGLAGGGGGGGRVDDTTGQTDNGGTGGAGGFGGGGGGGGVGSNGTGVNDGIGGVGGVGAGSGGSGGENVTAGGGGGGGLGAGGAVFNNSGAVLTIQNCTLTGNSATGGLGGTANTGSTAGSNGSGVGGAVYNRSGTVTIQFSTLSANTAADGGGAVYSYDDGTDPNLTIRASILADTPSGGNCAISGTHATNVGTNNIIEDATTTCATPSSTADPGLGALAGNGGPTQTRAITTGSFAYNYVPSGTDSCEVAPFDVDQRGSVRAPGSSNCDIGAFEIANTAPVVNAGIDQTITLPSNASMAATVTDDGLPVPPGVVTLTWSQVSGPGTATFSSTSVEDPLVSFSASGVYVLQLSAYDGALTTNDTVQVTVNPNPNPSGQISGNVFRDYDADATRDNSTIFLEPTIQYVDVKAYTTNGTPVATAVTDANGNYTLTGLTDGTRYRIEFTLPTDGSLDFLKPGAAGNTTVQFVTAPMTGVTVGFNDPSDYSQTDPPLITTKAAFGPRSSLTTFDPTGATGCIGADTPPCDQTDESIVGVTFGASGDLSKPTQHTTYATLKNTGSLYGMIYQRRSKLILAGTYFKNYADTGPIQTSGWLNGTDPLGAIYAVQAGTTLPNSAVYANLNKIINPATGQVIAGNPAGVDPRRTGLYNYDSNSCGTTNANFKGCWMHDPAAWDKVGAIGLGDLEEDGAEQYVFVVNLFDKKLYQLPIVTNPANWPVTTLAAPPVSIPNTCAVSSDAVPGALGYKDGKLYVGVTCTAKSTQNLSELKAEVWQFDPSTQTFEAAPPMFTMPLTHVRGCIWTNGGSEEGSNWPKNYPPPLVAPNDANCQAWANGATAPDGSTAAYNNMRWNPWPATWTGHYAANVGANGPGRPGWRFPPSNIGTPVGQGLVQVEYPHPWLSDISFDGNALVMGYRDINGDRTGNQVYSPTTNPTISPRVADSFASTAYDRQDGAGGATWSTNWTETNDDGTAGGGSIRITGGQLLLEGSAGNPTRQIWRQVDLSGSAYNSGATLTFACSATGSEAGDQVLVEVSSNGGTSYTTLATITGNTCSWSVRDFDITAYRAANTRIRFSRTADATDDDYNIDNVVISVTPSGAMMETEPLIINGAGFGDLQRACWNGAGWSLENNGTCGGVTTAGKDSGQGPGTPGDSINNTTGAAGSDGFLDGAGEWYWDDSGPGSRNPHTTNSQYSGTNYNGHEEVIMGGTFQRSGDPSVAVTIADQFTTGDGGVQRFSNVVDHPLITLQADGDLDPPAKTYPLVLNDGNPATGNEAGLALNHTQLYSNLFTTGATPAGFFGKANGLGDIEALQNPAPIEIGNRVWFDPDGNGTQDPAESTIPAPIASGVVVELWKDTTGDGIADTKVAQTTTSAAGNYLFSYDTNPNSPNEVWETGHTAVLPDTVYEIRIDSAQGSIGIYDYPTLANAVADLRDSDGTAIPDTGNGSPRTTIVGTRFTTGGPGENDHTLDFGFDDTENIVNLGNQVWFDTNNNGKLDGSEVGISGVAVDLYADTSGDGVLTVGVDTYIGTEITDASGFYNFVDLQPGFYIVHLPQDNWENDANGPINGAGKLIGLASSTGNNPTPDPDDAVNSDDNGYHLPGNGVVAMAVHMQVGQEPTNDGDGDDGNLTVDFGFFGLGAIGNYVWVDEDSNGYQDAGEPGIANVEVRLYSSAGALVATTYTDSNGGYLFDNLAPGTYYVDVRDGTGTDTTSTLPAGMSQTPPSNQTNADFGNQDHGTTAIPGGGGLTGYPVSIGYVSGTTYPLENLTADFGYNYNPDTAVNNPTSTPTAALGDRVWIDADGDGRQDDGEVGVSGVTVKLYTAGPDGIFGNGDDAEVNVGPDGVLGTGDDAAGGMQTNANGFYRFDNLAPGAYAVKVTSSAGASHDVLNTGDYTQTGDPDHFAVTDTSAGNNDNQTTAPVVLGPGDVFLNADFGYQPDTGVTGSIGDTIWFDADADGNGPSMTAIDDATQVTQGAGGTADASEYGIPGVTVALIRDDDGDGVVEATDGNGIWDAGEPIIATTMTNANGQYLFSGLPITDGQGSDDYIVWVNDTDNVLGEMVPTYDKDGKADVGANGGADSVLGMSAVANLTTTPVRDQDFGYTNTYQQTNTALGTPLGLIGDYVWLDADRGNDQDEVSAGIEGVVVELLNSTGTTVLATTTTDENGYYSFGGLPLNTSYIVRIASTNDDAGGPLEGMTNTGGPSGGSGDVGPVVSLTTANPNNLVQDFGYAAPLGAQGRIGNLVWLDADADGFWDGPDGNDGILGGLGADDDEPLIAGVTVDLYRDLNGNGKVDAGEPRVATTVTSATATTTSGDVGNYLFTGLSVTGTGDSDAPAEYVVDVSDRDGVLTGYWHSLGTTDVTDNSQVDPDAAEISSGAPDNLRSDFGYYIEPAAVGNFVWVDSNADGIQDPGEPGINGVEVTLTITWPAGNGTTTLKTVTGDDPSTVAVESGWYSFGNLLLDEDYNGDGVGSEPTHTISVALGQSALAGYAPTLTQVLSPPPDQEDSDNPLGTPAQPVQGLTDTAQQTDPTDEGGNASYDFGFIGLGAIGNRVWVDENSDGYQDAGEPGIPNAEVRLYNGSGTLVATTYTDANGGYRFDNVVPGSYYVDVRDGTGGTTNTLPTGLAQTPPSTLLGADFGNQSHGTAIPGGGGLTGYPVTIGGSAPLENLTADFGYNWNPKTQVDNPSGSPTATLGDRVWIDVDGDGFQDANEVGVSGATVRLYTAGADGLFGTGDDVEVNVGPDGILGTGDDAAGGMLTNANGNYLFDNLPPGAYVVKVTSDTGASHAILTGGQYNQTGDPDHFGTTGTNNDNQTTSPVVLGPGDVFLNADFGYQPSGATLGSIGDTIWFDADASGTATMDTGEYGILGVTVALIRDTNGNGTWDASEPIIATDITDAAGNYLFPGLSLSDNGDGNPGDADYIVWVNDTNNVLGEMVQTYDQDSPLDDRSATALTAGTPNDLLQDFSYTAAGHTSDVGLIGDTVWFDTNNSGGNQTTQGSEPGIEGVLMELVGPGTDGALGTGDDVVLRTMRTDENGHYAFGGLPLDDGVGASGADYRVRVASSNFAAGGVLEGLANTYDPDGTTPVGTGQTVTLSGANKVNLDQDFSYYTSTPATLGRIGNLVWLDTNADGVWDADGADNVLGGAGADDDEPLIAGVTVDLYRDLNGDGDINAGEPRIATTTTAGTATDHGGGDLGNYLFTGLPITGGGDADAWAEYVVDVSDRDGVLAGYWHSLGAPGTTNNSQVDPYAVEIGTGSGGQPPASNLTADFGYYVEPAAVGNYVWSDTDGDGVQESGEPPIANVEVTLTITYPDNTVTTLKTTTDANGYYSFGNLLQDEDYRQGSGTATPAANQPAFTITFGAVSGKVPTVVDGGSNNFLDSDWNGTTAVPALPVQGQTDTALTNTTGDIASYDAGFAVRDLQVSTNCNDYSGGTAPFVIAEDTVTHAIGSVLPTTGVNIQHTFGTPNDVAYHSFSATNPPGSKTIASVVGETVTFTLVTDNVGETPWSFAPGQSWVVQVLVTYTGTGAVLTMSNTAVVSSQQTDVNGTNNTGACSSTTPVTLAYFKAERTATGARLNWTTVTEAGNVGFNLYEVTPVGRRLLNERVIPTQRLDSLEPLNYAYDAKGATGGQFVIEDVAWDMRRRGHGTFDVGVAYGRVPDPAPIDWAAIRAEETAQATDRAARATVELADGPAPGAAWVQLQVSRDGVYRVTYEDLKAAGFDLAGVAINTLAVLREGRPVPVRTSPDATFGAGGFVEFYGEAAKGLYTRTRMYYLAQDAARRAEVGRDGAAPPAGAPATSYLEPVVVDNNREYSPSSAGTDPWYDTHMKGDRTERSWAFPLTVDRLAGADSRARLRVSVWGLTSHRGVEPDHHLVLALNDTPVADERFDGQTALDVDVAVPAGVLKEGANTLKVTLPGDTGYDLDHVMLDRYGLVYPRSFVARDGRLSFEAAGASFEVTGLPSADVVVYRHAAGQAPALLSGARVTKSPDGTYTARFAGGDQTARYEVWSAAALLAPTYAAPRPAVDITPAGTDYLIISHPSFMAGLDEFVAYHEAQGLRVKVVDVEDVYARYGDGNFDPAAIQAYVAVAHGAGVRYVLLVGGDTYDYMDFLGMGAFSFMPSPYVKTMTGASFVPADPVYADADRDGVPDLAIGRWPVRTGAELAAVVAKTLAYAGKDYGRTSVFAADQDEAMESYTADSERFITGLPDGWAAERAQLSVQGPAQARERLLAELNDGVALTSYVGHSGPTAWTFSGLFSGTDALALTNAGRPTVVTQWGCWNTYHQTPRYSTLGQDLLLAGDRGAAAVLGATTLTLARSERSLGALVTPRLTSPGVSIGTAVLEAKRELARTHPDMRDVILGWTILGDPALMVDPGGAEPPPPPRTQSVYLPLLTHGEIR